MTTKIYEVSFVVKYGGKVIKRNKVETMDYPKEVSLFDKLFRTNKYLNYVTGKAKIDGYIDAIHTMAVTLEIVKDSSEVDWFKKASKQVKKNETKRK